MTPERPTSLMSTPSDSSEQPNPRTCKRVRLSHSPAEPAPAVLPPPWSHSSPRQPHLLTAQGQDTARGGSEHSGVHRWWGASLLTGGLLAACLQRAAQKAASCQKHLRVNPANWQLSRASVCPGPSPAQPDAAIGSRCSQGRGHCPGAGGSVWKGKRVCVCAQARWPVTAGRHVALPDCSKE